MSDITNDSVDEPSSPTNGSPPATATEGSSNSHIEKNNSKILCDGAPSSEEGIVEKEELIVLPPEVWASVMECKLVVCLVLCFFTCCP